jgi:hypothetical protein
VVTELDEDPPEVPDVCVAEETLAADIPLSEPDEDEEDDPPPDVLLNPELVELVGVSPPLPPVHAAARTTSVNNPKRLIRMWLSIRAPSEIDRPLIVTCRPCAKSRVHA